MLLVTKHTPWSDSPSGWSSLNQPVILFSSVRLSGLLYARQCAVCWGYNDVHTQSSVFLPDIGADLRGLAYEGPC